MFLTWANASAYEALKAIPAFVGKKGASPFVFVSPDTEEPYEKPRVGHAFPRAAAAAGLAVEGSDKVTFHTLRHTAVSQLVAAGVPERKIMKLVGHSTQAKVSRYAHLSPDGLWEAADALAEGHVSPQKRTTSVQTDVARKAAL